MLWFYYYPGGNTRQQETTRRWQQGSRLGPREVLEAPHFSQVPFVRWALQISIPFHRSTQDIRDWKGP